MKLKKISILSLLGLTLGLASCQPTITPASSVSTPVTDTTPASSAGASSTIESTPDSSQTSTITATTPISSSEPTSSTPASSASASSTIDSTPDSSQTSTTTPDSSSEPTSSTPASSSEGPVSTPASDSSSLSSGTTSSTGESSTSSSVAKKTFALTVTAPHFTVTAFAPAEGSTIEKPLTGDALDLSAIEEDAMVLLKLVDDPEEEGVYTLDFADATDGIAQVMLGAVAVQVNVKEGIAMMTMPNSATTLDFTSYIKAPVVTYQVTVTAPHMKVSAHLRTGGTWYDPEIGEAIDLAKVPAKANIILALTDDPDDAGNYVLDSSKLSDNDIDLGNGITGHLTTAKDAICIDNIGGDVTIDLTSFITTIPSYIGTHSIFTISADNNNKKIDSMDQKNFDLKLDTNGTGSFAGMSFNYKVSDSNTLQIPYTSDKQIASGYIFFNESGDISVKFYGKLNTGDTSYHTIKGLYLAGKEVDGITRLVSDSDNSFAWNWSAKEEKGTLLTYNGIIHKGVTYTDFKYDNNTTYYYFTLAEGDKITSNGKDKGRLLIGRQYNSNGRFELPDKTAGEFVVDGNTKGNKLVFDGYELATLGDKHGTYEQDYKTKNYTVTWQDGTETEYAIDFTAKTATTVVYIDSDPFTDGKDHKYAESTTGLELTFNNGKVTLADPKDKFKAITGHEPKTLTVDYKVSKSTITFTIHCEIDAGYSGTSDGEFDFKLGLNSAEQEAGFPNLKVNSDVQYFDYYEDYTIIKSGTTFTAVTEGK